MQPHFLSVPDTQEDSKVFAADPVELPVDTNTTNVNPKDICNSSETTASNVESNIQDDTMAQSSFEDDVTPQGGFGSDVKLEAPEKGQSEYSCNSCEKSSTNALSLDSHMKQDHESEVGFFRLSGISTKDNHNDSPAVNANLESTIVKPETRIEPVKVNK